VATRDLLTIRDVLRQHEGRNLPAVLAPGRSPLSWNMLALFVDEITEDLNSRGFGHGTRVALLLPNGPATAVALLALSCATTVAPINPAYVEPELEFAFRDLRIDAVIVPAGEESVGRSVARALGLTVIELRPTSDAPAGIFQLGDGAVRSRCRKGAPDPDDIAFVLHTSGTTAKPKVVPLLHSRITLTASNIARVLELSTRDLSLNVMPLFHVHGILNVLLSSAIAGASVICTDGFNPKDFFHHLEKFAVTWYSAVPTIHQGVLAAAKRSRTSELKALRFVRSSSAPLPVQIASRLEELFGVPVIESYGMTEVDQIASNPLPPRQRKLGSVGVPGGVEIRILDEHQALVPRGRTGQVAVGGPNVMPGYENNADANRAAFVDGFFLTGDMGWQDEDGYLFLVGRAKEMINRGGEKITPREIDDCLLQFPGVTGAACFGLPHPYLGEEVAAAVVAVENEQINLRDLRRHLAERLAPFKVPATIHIVDRLPVGPTGKIVRRKLSELTAAPSLHAEGACRGKAEADSFERQLIAIWEEVLDIRPIDLSDDFYEIGGSSLLAQQLFARLESAFGQPVPLAVVHKAGTVRALAAHLRDAGWPTSRPKPDREISREAVVPCGPTAAGGSVSPIAVVGMSGLYPGAEDLSAFKEHIEANRVLVDSGFAARSSEKNIPSHWRAAFLDLDPFDLKMPGLSVAGDHALPRDAAYLLRIAFSACEDAGYGEAFNHQRTGIWVAQDKSRTEFGDIDPGTLRPASLAAFLSTRFNCRGPILDVDTKCSSALVALQVAMHSLQCYACDTAIVAAISIRLDKQSFATMDVLGQLSRSGRISALEDDADGWVPGEGVGALLLRRLDDAIRDGDNIRGVVDSVETGHGGRGEGILTVDVESRVDMIRLALSRSRFAAADIVHIELHSAGNRLGDALEITVFDRAFAGANGPWSIGALAASIGYLEAASGMAALQKAILMIESRRILPMPRRKRPNAALIATQGRFCLTEENRDWPNDRRGGGVCISSVGTSGVAAVAVLGRGPAPQSLGDRSSVQLFCLSADTEVRLRTYAHRIAEWLKSSQADLADVCGTVNVGRCAFSQRVAIVARSSAELVAALFAFTNGDVKNTGTIWNQTASTPDCKIVLATDDPKIASEVLPSNEALRLLDNTSGPRLSAFATLLIASGVRTHAIEILGVRESAPLVTEACGKHLVVRIAEDRVIICESGGNAKDLGPPERGAFAAVAGWLWCRGVPIDRALLQRLDGYRKVSLPGLPFGSNGREEASLLLDPRRPTQGCAANALHYRIIYRLKEVVQSVIPSLPEFGSKDSLLRTGIDSLKIAFITHEIEFKVGIRLSPAALFEHPSLYQLATFLLTRFPDECQAWSGVDLRDGIERCARPRA
jgi:oxalate---CoA ligase